MSVQLKNKTEVHAHISRASSQGNIFNFHLHSPRETFSSVSYKDPGEYFQKTPSYNDAKKNSFVPYW